MTQRGALLRGEVGNFATALYKAAIYERLSDLILAYQLADEDHEAKLELLFPGLARVARGWSYDEKGGWLPVMATLFPRLRDLDGPARLEAEREPIPGSTEAMVADLAEREGAQEERAAGAAAPVFEWVDDPVNHSLKAEIGPGIEGNFLMADGHGHWKAYAAFGLIDMAQAPDLASAQQAAQAAYLEWVREMEAVPA